MIAMQRTIHQSFSIVAQRERTAKSMRNWERDARRQAFLRAIERASADHLSNLIVTQ